MSTTPNPHRKEPASDNHDHASLDDRPPFIERSGPYTLAADGRVVCKESAPEDIRVLASRG
jgi:hypothetical protein